MTTLAPARQAVKTAVAVLFDSASLRSGRSSGFGAGLAPLPSHDAPVVAAASKWATDAEYRRHFLGSTLSPAEWDARLDAMARESAELDAVCRGLRGS